MLAKAICRRTPDAVANDRAVDGEGLGRLTCGKRSLCAALGHVITRITRARLRWHRHRPWLAGFERQIREGGDRCTCNDWQGHGWLLGQSAAPTAPSLVRIQPEAAGGGTCARHSYNQPDKPRNRVGVLLCCESGLGGAVRDDA